MVLTLRNRRNKYWPIVIFILFLYFPSLGISADHNPQFNSPVSRSASHPTGVVIKSGQARIVDLKTGEIKAELDLPRQLVPRLTGIILSLSMPKGRHGVMMPRLGEIEEGLGVQMSKGAQPPKGQLSLLIRMVLRGVMI